MKKRIIGVICALVVMIVCVLINVGYSKKVISNNEKKSYVDDGIIDIDEKEDNEEEKEEEKDDKIDVSDSTKKIAVVYFSVTGTTKSVASYVNENVGGTLIEVVPLEAYTDDDIDYVDSNSRSASENRDDTARPKLKEKIDLSGYDVIYLGYPVWYDNVPKIIITLLDTSDISGKTVIPFCTSSSSEITNSLNVLKKYKTDVKWVEGKKINNNKEEVKKWIDSLKY